jgi:hypothetical protein
MCETMQSSHRLCPVIALVLALLTPVASGVALVHTSVPFLWGGILSQGTRKSRWSRVGTSKIILDFYPVICLVR